MNLPVVLNRRIVDFLTSLPNINDNNVRHALIQRAGLDLQLQGQVMFSESATHFFELLVPQLIQYGQLEDGRNAVEAVLEAAKNFVGEPKRAYCESLIQQLRAVSSEGEHFTGIPSDQFNILDKSGVDAQNKTPYTLQTRASTPFSRIVPWARSSRACVEYYIHGKEAWRTGVIGLFTRVRGIIFLISVGLGMSGIFLWLPIFKPLWEISFSIPILGLILLLIASSTSILVIVAVIVRKKSMRSLYLKWQLHEIAHSFRDWVVHVEKRYTRYHKEQEHSSSPDNFRFYFNEACNRISLYFQKLVHDDTICCSIRLADKFSENWDNQEVYYATAGRSVGLSSSREKQSVPIPANKGIPRFFLVEQNACRGVLIYHDIQAAIGKGLFEETPNEKDFRDEIRTLMVTPINGWAGTRQAMIGLLYVTSRRDPFTAIHVDPIRTIADILGIVIPQVVEITFRKQYLSHSERKEPNEA